LSSPFPSDPVTSFFGGGGGAGFVALALLYYFALEAVTGQTVGKRLLGLRVSRRGERASVGAVAGRTLLRVVDWLRLLYLVGFLTTRTSQTSTQTTVVYRIKCPRGRRAAWGEGNCDATARP
jgi:uncharacterized RDD family membrane protein YckC